MITDDLIELSELKQRYTRLCNKEKVLNYLIKLDAKDYEIEHTLLQSYSKVLKNEKKDLKMSIILLQGIVDNSTIYSNKN